MFGRFISVFFIIIGMLMQLKRDIFHVELHFFFKNQTGPFIYRYMRKI